jgi:ParB family chromosome partitioning protein
MTAVPQVEIVSGAEIEIPLNKLKKSPRNARRTPHSAEALEALAASIAAKRLLQKPVVEPERDDDGAMTGFWLVTIGEGRRLALRLLAQRKLIGKGHLVPCLVETQCDPQEISLDENVTRSAMHPADQFEAFQDLHARKGWSAEEIAARFGVNPSVVRQRLRLACVSPKLIALYRQEDLVLDQLMAFAVTQDHARQEEVWGKLSYNRSAAFIRQALTSAKVAASDRRAVFVGVEAYEAAGGDVTRDLFTEVRGGWLDDVALLDRLAREKLDGLAVEIAADEGWKWGEAHLDYPSGHGLARVYPQKVERAEDVQAQMEALAGEYDGLIEKFSDAEDLPPDVETRLGEIEAQLQAFGDGYAYAADDLARGGVFVMLGHDGAPRIERGFIRPEDAAPAAPREDDAPEVPNGEDGPTQETAEEDGAASLPDRLVRELAAYRTASLRDALAQDPDVALRCLLHVMVLDAFHGSTSASCLDVRTVSRRLEIEAPQIEDGAAALRNAERHGAWARQVPSEASEAWAFVCDLDSDSAMALLAHCAALTLDAVQGWSRRSAALEHADALARRLALDMRADWRPDESRYLGRVTKALVLGAVAEAAGEEAAGRLASLKKPEMVAAAEPLVLDADWLPAELRTAPCNVQGAGEKAA